MLGCLGLCQLLRGSLGGTCPLVSITMMTMGMIGMMVMLVIIVVVVVRSIITELKLSRYTYNTRNIHKFLLASRYEGIPENEYACF